MTLIALTSARLDAAAEAADVLGAPGVQATYRRQTEAIRETEVQRFTLSFGPIEEGAGGGRIQWLALRATKINGQQFAAWILAGAYPTATAQESAALTARYIFQERDSSPVEFVHRFNGSAVLPSVGAWPDLWPQPAQGGFRGRTLPQEVVWLGHRYVMERSEKDVAFHLPATPRKVELLPDALIGVPSNSRTKDRMRRYDGTDYEMVRLTREDYAEMIRAGMNCFRVDAEQAEWIKDEPVFYWGVGGTDVAFPECLYRSTYMGATIHIDEPAVATRDYVIRPKLKEDPSLRRTLTSDIVLDAFKKNFHEAVTKGSPTSFMAGMRGRADVDLGTMNLTQRNLYSWETMVASAAWQLTAEPEGGPCAMVFEPPGRIGTRRTLPEMNMAYGCQLPPDDPANLIDPVIGFLRGAARAAGKDWGISIYGSVDRDDAPWWLTHAYDLGAKYFFYWDNYQSACVPYAECLALSRHISDHAKGHPERDHQRLRRAAEVAILLPPGYDLGHVRMGRGDMWGLGELNLERLNRHGVSYRQVMANFFTEIERCLRMGVAFDLMWDLEGLKLDGYREVVHVREDGHVEVVAEKERRMLDAPRKPERPAGEPPKVAVELAADPSGDKSFTANARVEEGSAPVYYTTGADRRGTFPNAIVLWELFGPAEEDYVWLQYAGAAPVIRREEDASIVEIKFKVERSGSYRLRAAACDLVGRTTVVWTEFKVAE